MFRNLWRWIQNKRKAKPPYIAFINDEMVYVDELHRQFKVHYTVDCSGKLIVRIDRDARRSNDVPD